MDLHFVILQHLINLIYLSDSDPEEIEVQKLAKTVSEVVGISDTVQFKAGKVRQGTIHILRKHLYCTKLNLTTYFFFYKN